MDSRARFHEMIDSVLPRVEIARSGAQTAGRDAPDFQILTTTPPRAIGAPPREVAQLLSPCNRQMPRARQRDSILALIWR